MSRPYSLAHKRLILRLLSAFNGDIALTARFAEIPERTLREWRQEAVRSGGLPRSRIQFVQQQYPPRRRRS